MPCLAWTCLELIIRKDLSVIMGSLCPLIPFLALTGSFSCDK